MMVDCIVEQRESRWRRRFRAVYLGHAEPLRSRWRGPWRRHRHQAEEDGRRFTKKRRGK